MTLVLYYDTYILEANMSKTTALIIGAIVVLAVVGTTIIVQGSKKTSTPSQTASPSALATTPVATENSSSLESNQSLVSPSPTQSAATATVTYDGNSFSPANLTVKQGTAVTFTNSSTQPLWVASDPHPVHNGLAGFDARKGSAQGGSYTYTFKEKGTFGYHNHLRSSDTGTIIVE